jgi:hypothetical protein
MGVMYDPEFSGSHRFELKKKIEIMGFTATGIIGAGIYNSIR